ncbi:hypothetical protein C8R46DRAFT_885953 [Mycena filopes]|nr:hypothetical protein C8R46DRAFT_885953 [Mycena filopes]
MPAPEVTPRPPNARPVLGHVNLMADTLIANATLDDLRAIVRSMVASATPGIAAALTAAARERLGHSHPPAHSHSHSSSAPPNNSFNAPHQCCIAPNGQKHPHHQAQQQLFTPTGTPTPHLHELLKRARALYGSGMGFASLGLLTTAVRATIGLRWAPDSSSSCDTDSSDSYDGANGGEGLGDMLAVIDADIAQAIQSCKEELESGRLSPPSPNSHPSSPTPNSAPPASSLSLAGARKAVAELRGAVEASKEDVKKWGGEFPFERAGASLPSFGAGTAGGWKV